MSARLALLLALAALLAVPTVALGATKHGITPKSPKAGSTIPVGERPTMKGKVKGPGQVYVHVCKSKHKDDDGLICSDEAIKRAKKKNGRFSVKLDFFDFPGFWLNSPGTYYWQAHRIACIAGSDLKDCRQEGPIVKFKVG
jgi:hypothetical protein